MALDISSLESTYYFTYAPHLVFENPSFEILLKDLCHKQGVPKEALHYGTLYNKELTLGLEIPSTIEWVHPEVGYGLYSSVDISEGTFIGEYTGLISHHTPYYKMSNYCFQYPILQTEKHLSIDAENYGNLTRFINHSFTPNLQILHAFHHGLYHVILVASRSIKQGEHLTYNYGHGYWYLRGAPFDIRLLLKEEDSYEGQLDTN